MKASVRFVASVVVAAGAAVLAPGMADASHDFVVPDVRVDESAGTAKIVIEPSCPVDKIEYRTEDDTATSGEDYTAVSGTLTNAPWEFEVPILEDGIREDDEIVRVIVSKLTAPGAYICVGWHQATARLTIGDNDPVSTGTAKEESSGATGSAPGSTRAAASSELGPDLSPGRGVGILADVDPARGIRLVDVGPTGRVLPVLADEGASADPATSGGPWLAAALAGAAALVVAFGAFRVTRSGRTL